jgi:hypothetical protein
MPIILATQEVETKRIIVGLDKMLDPHLNELCGVAYPCGPRSFEGGDRRIPVQSQPIQS